MAVTENLYETREGFVKLAATYNQILDDQERARRSGHLSDKLSRPSDVKRGVVEALEQSALNLIPLPQEFVDLIRRLLGTSDDHARDRVKFPAAAVARIEKETGLTGRPLVRKCNERGIKIKESTLRAHKKRQSAQRKTL